MSWIDGARAHLRLLFARNVAEARAADEFRFHLEMEAERLMHEEGLDAEESRRRALLAFGGEEKYREEMREGRRPAWLSGMSLDFRLGFRMLVKYPGLAITGGLALAFATWVGAVTFQLSMVLLQPSLPLPDGDRIVQLRNWDVVAQQADARALHDFAVWRETLQTVTDLGAFRDATRNLIAGEGDAGPVRVAEITASAFRIAPDPPLLGRTLVAADEAVGASAVVVLGYDLWQTRFGGDSGVLGRSVQLGDERATVVGVMPDGYEFPIAHDVWTPLAINGTAVEPLSGAGITIFGRLAPGVSFGEAQAELTAVGQRMAAEFPHTHEHLRPQVKEYAKLLLDPGDADRLALLMIYLFVIALLVLISGNVALLLFARAATRESELVVRSALGASRSRIGVQLFIEALVLGSVAALFGLAAADLALRQLGVEFLTTNLGQLPFWYDVRLSPATVFHAMALTLLAAAIAGVLPALKATRGLGSRLREGSAGGGGLQFGGVWTAVIVAQVAATIAFPALAYVEYRAITGVRSYDPGFAAEEYVGVRLDMDAGGVQDDDAAANEEQAARYATSLELLRERIEAEPGITGVAFVDRLPRTYHRERLIELDDAAGSAATAAAAAVDGLKEVNIAAVDAAYFELLAAPILAGRGFGPADFEPDARAIIVDERFVDRVLHGRNAVGRRVRFGSPPKADQADTRPWYEIVGVVPALGMRHPLQKDPDAGLYLPTVPGTDGPVHVVLHTRGDPLVVASSIRTLAAAVDPTLRLTSVQRLDQVADDVLWFVGLWLRITIVLTAVALLLSLAGIYAVLSYTVARRTREIGIRVALGANRRRLVASIFRRPLTQVGLGVVAGGILVVVGAFTVGPALAVPRPGAPTEAGGGALRYALFLGYILLMFGVCLLACVVPTRRALGVEPTEALRAQ